MGVTIDDIRRAAETIAGTVERTPCRVSRRLSDLTGATVVLKFENLQHTGSFKDRGALVKLSSLSAEERARGVIAVSAGNHAQGVAYHAQQLGIPATIVMPEGTPHVKVRQTESYGANIMQHGDTLDAAAELAESQRTRHDLVFIHPYDDPLIIAGQGTVALEMLAQHPALDTLIVPVGGGGLISGCAIAAKALRPDLRIVGVETELYPSMYQLVHGEPIHCGGQSIAEGIAVKAPGAHTAAVVRELVDDLLLVPEEQIEIAIEHLVVAEKTVVEGAGAAALAAVLADPGRFRGATVGLILTGGNIDTRLLSSILMRGLMRSGRITRMRVEIDDRPGVLAQVAQIIGEGRGNILEVAHQRMFPDVPAKLAELDVVIETRDRVHVRDIETRLRSAGFMVRELVNTPDAV